MLELFVLNLVVQVHLQDDGGRDYGGIDHFNRSIALTLTSPIIDAFLKSRTLFLSECQICGTVLVTKVLCSEIPDVSCADVSSYFFENRNVSVHLSFVFQYFSIEPLFNQTLNELSFMLAPFTFGIFNITLVLMSVSESAKNLNFEIEVAHVNQRPSFRFPRPYITILETSYGNFEINFYAANSTSNSLSTRCHNLTGLCTAREFATSILPGQNLTIPTGPAGEDWAEQKQHLTFFVHSMNQSPQPLPFLSSEGTLSFNVYNFFQPRNAFSAILFDDGGTDLGGTDESNPLHFFVDVDLFFHPPQFEFVCDADDARILCSSECILHPQNCTLSLTIGKSCRDCSVYDSCNDGQNCTDICYEIDAFVKGIKPAYQEYERWKRSEQNMSFIITAAEYIHGFFGVNGLPRIDPKTGALNFCLAGNFCMSEHVNIPYEIVLTDDIGSSPGQNTSMGLKFNLIVNRINQRPSFQLAGSSISVWQHSGLTMLPSFAKNILRGNQNSSLYDCEIDQKITFQATYDISFFSQVSMDVTSGNLSFMLFENSVGTTFIEFVLKDNGGSLENGSPLSFTRTLKVDVFGLFTHVIMKSQLDIQEISILAEYFKNTLKLSSSQVYITLQNHESIGCNSAPTMQIWTFDDGNVPWFCLSDCVDASNNTFPSSWIGTTYICIFSDVIDSAITLANLFLMSFKNISEPPSVVKRNFRAQPYFDLKNHDLQYLGSDLVLGQKVLEEKFVINLVEPENVEIDLNGNEDLNFDVMPIGRRAYPYLFPWILDFSDGGLMTANPTIEIKCKKSTDILVVSSSCEGNLSMNINPSYNGQILFSVKMQGAELKQNFTVSVRLAFSFQDHIFLTTPEKSIVVVSDFLVANFASSLSGGLMPFDYAVEIREVDLVTDARIASSVLHSNVSNLFLAVSLGRVGVQTLWLRAGDMNAVTDAKSFDVFVLDRNFPPAFAFDCQSSYFECNGDCALNRSEGNCTVIMNTAQNCNKCNATDGCCVHVRSVVSWIPSIGPSFWNESSQQVTFFISPMSDSSSTTINLLEIDAVSGDLTICPSAQYFGSSSFRIVLFDNGGTANGGSNISKPVYFEINVAQVNQRPSFEIFSNHTIQVWTSHNNRWIYPKFATNISSGISNAAGFNFALEHYQDVTFKLFNLHGHTAAACSNIAACSALTLINIDVDGTLQFQLQPGWSGVLLLQAYLENNGSADDCGKNLSVPHNFTIFVVESYVQFFFIVSRDFIFQSSLIFSARQQVASLLDTYIELVVIDPFWTENFTSTSYHKRLLSMDQSSTPLFSLYILSFSKRESAYYYAIRSNISKLIDAVFQPDLNLTFISARVYARNYEPYFDILLSKVQSGCRNVVQIESFLNNITGAPESLINSNGSEFIEIVLYPARYRPNNSSWWIINTNGGLFVENPTLTLVCDPYCSTADLGFEVKAAYNGEVEYIVSILQNNVAIFSRSFTIIAGPCFICSQELILYESGPYTNISCFAKYYYGFASNFSILNASFELESPEYSSGLFKLPPMLESHGFCANLVFQIKPFWSGNITMNISALNVQRSFTLVFLPVNYPPSFSLATQVLFITENGCTSQVCTRKNFIKSISAGPERESSQLLTFNVFPLTAVAGLFQHIPNVTLIRDNFTGNWSALLILQTVKDRFSVNVSYFNLSLVDNGIPSKSTSALFGVWIQEVNEAPSFRLVSSKIVVWENSAAFIFADFAQNISAGSPEESKLQSVSFVVYFEEQYLFLPDRQPVLFSNGTLEFQPSPGQYGSAVLSVVLFDNGGTQWNGTNSSKIVPLLITINRVNQPPDFCITLVNRSIVLYASNVSSNESLLFATDIVSGPEIEINQTLTFFVVGMEMKTSEAKPFYENLHVYIESKRELSRNISQQLNQSCKIVPSYWPQRYGFISFTLIPYRFGELKLQIVLFDSGGTEGYGRNASSQVNITVTVLPVSQQPSFELLSPKVAAMEGIKDQVIQNVFHILSTGGDGQNTGGIFFIFEGSSSFANLSANCTVGNDCSNSFVSLHVTPKPHIFGNFSVHVALKAAPCCDGRGLDTSEWALLIIEILPINNPPSFSLLSGFLSVNEGFGISSACVSSTGSPMDSIWAEYRSRPGSSIQCIGKNDAYFLEYSIDGFAYDISVGDYESYSPECSGNILCESQKGTFHIQDLNPNISSLLFSVVPVLSFPGGRLNFTLRPYSCGTSAFHLYLTDQGALDGTSKSSIKHNLTIRILPVNHAPDFVVETVQVFDDMGFVERTLIENIVANGFGAAEAFCPYRQQQMLSFYIEFESVALFEASPTFQVDGTKGVLLFTIKNHENGNASGIVTVASSNGMSTSKAFYVTVLHKIVKPTFQVNQTLSTVHVNQGSGIHIFRGFVFAITSGLIDRDQKMSFLVIQQSDPTLLSNGPNIGIDGVLCFTVRTDVAGWTNVTIILQDSPYNPNPFSDTASFQIIVMATQSKPVLWLSSHQLSLKENSGAASLTKLELNYTTQNGFLPSSEIIFMQGMDGIKFKEIRKNLFSSALMLAIDYVFSHDQDHLYVAEYSTNTISVWATKMKVDNQSAVLLNRIFHPNLQGPSGIDISRDGRFVYVSCASSSAILTFTRNILKNSCSYGALDLQIKLCYFGVQTVWILWKKNFADKGKNISYSGMKYPGPYPMMGIGPLKVSHDLLNLYAVTSDGTVLVFTRNSTTGAIYSLEIRPTSDGRFSGPCGLALSSNGLFVFIVSWKESALLAFKRESTHGYLQLSDSVRNGDRLLWKYQEYLNIPINKIEASEMGWCSGRQYPLRLGNGPSANNARGSKHFKMNNRFFLAVAASDPDPALSDGMAVLYVWNSSQEEFCLFQEFYNEKHASLIEFFSLDGDQHYLVICNSFPGDISGNPLNVYAWDPSIGLFKIHHQPTFGVTSGVNIVSMCYFFAADKHFLALALHTWNLIPDERDSTLLVWNKQIVRSHNQHTIVPAFGFEHFQDISGPACSVDFAKFAQNDLLFFTKAQSKSNQVECIGSTLEVYRWELEHFRVVQSIDAAGGYGVEAFSFYEGNFVAIARRQVQQQMRKGDYSDFDVESQIYKWDPAHNSLFLFQVLNGLSFMSAPENETPPNKAFEFASQSNISSVDMLAQRVQSFRGVTAFRSFFCDGEQYLAVAQSVCNLYMETPRCQMVQPKSAILQFNQVTGKFSELLVSSTKNRYQRTTLTHQYPLRINAGKAVGWDFIEIGEKKFLLALSLTTGALLFEWRFQYVSGLYGARFVTCDHEGTNVFVTSTLDSALVHVSRHSTNDVMRSEPQQESESFRFQGAYFSTLTSFDFNNQDIFRYLNLSTGVGFQGAVKTWVSGEAGSSLLGLTEIVVSIDLPMDMRLCPSIEVADTSDHGANISYPCSSTATPNLSSVFLKTVFTCLNLSFMVACERFQSSLCPTARFSLDGLLEVETAPFQHGNVMLEIRLESTKNLLYLVNYSSVSWLKNQTSVFSDPHYISIEVLPVNYRPSFTASDVFTTFRPLHWASNVSDRCDLCAVATFAKNVSAGIGEETQNMSWKFDFTNQDIFSRRPYLHIIRLGNLTFGSIAFQVRWPISIPTKSCFNVSLVDDGPSNYLLGDRNESNLGNFCLFLRLANGVLQVSNRTLTIVGPGLTFIANFVVDMKDNCGFRSSLNSVFSVWLQPVESKEKERDFFSLFDVDACGNLKLSVFPWIRGSFVVDIKRKSLPDYVQTARILLNVTYSGVQSELCQFKYISPTVISESNTVLYHNIPNAFNMSSVSALLCDGSVLFLVNVSNMKLFESPPEILSNFSLKVRLRPNSTGTSRFLFQLKHSICGVQKFFSAIFQVVRAVVPTFSILKIVQTTSSSSPQIIVGVVFDICQGQMCKTASDLKFSVSWASNDFSFISAPEIDHNGSLRFQILESAYGVAYLNVAIQGSATGIQNVVLIVYPRIEVKKIVPSFGPIQGGTAVTLFGVFLIPALEYVENKVAVFVGGSACLNVTWTLSTYNSSSAESKELQRLTCNVAPGLGLARVLVKVVNMGMERKLQIENLYAYTAALYSGTLSSGGGFLAFGPQSSDPANPSHPGPSLQDSGISLSGSGFALVCAMNKIFVGGSFLSVHGIRVDHIFAWDGMKVSPLGKGLDGSVNSFATFYGQVICGGTFTRGCSAQGKCIKSGGLIGWSGTDWVLLHRSFVGSVVHCLSANQTHLYVAGRHTKSESESLGALAVFDGISWSAVGGGVFGGDVYAIAINEGSVFAGGSFTLVGSTLASKLAQWDGKQWHSLGSFDGTVKSISVSGQILFVGGEFVNACGLGLSYLMQLDSGICKAVSQGKVNGAVLSSKIINGCLYFGGLFNSAGSEGGLQNVGRWCCSTSSFADPTCSLQQIDGVQNLGPVLQISTLINES